MSIDVVIFVVLALAAFRGFSKGLILAVLSTVGVLIGSILSLKLGHTAAQYIVSSGIAKEKIAVILGFVSVFIITMIVIRLIVNALEGVLKVAMLGWVNKLGGLLLYVLLTAFVISLLLWLANKTGFDVNSALNNTVLAKPLYNIAPAVLELLSSVVPFIKELIGKLNNLA